MAGGFTPHPCSEVIFALASGPVEAIHACALRGGGGSPQMCSYYLRRSLPQVSDYLHVMLQACFSSRPSPSPHAERCTSEAAVMRVRYTALLDIPAQRQLQLQRASDSNTYFLSAVPFGSHMP